MSKYFPVSALINDDPEVWTFTEMYGDRALRTLLEVFRILEENRNVWKLVDRWEFVLARKLRQTPANIRSEVDQMLANGWLEVGQWLASGRPAILYAPNYSKYHKTRAGVSPPPNLTEPNLTYKKEDHKNDLRKKSAPLEPLQQKRRTSYPENFEVKPELLLWALNHEISDPGKELEAFHDYHVSKGSLFIDWNAAFRTWLRNSKRFSGNGKAVQVEGELSDRTKRILRRGL